MHKLSIIGNAIQTMTSREIAALTGKAHPKVTADIESMLFELGEDAALFRHIYLDSMNREQVEYRLDRELTETLLTGYSAVVRRKVIARWRELEAQAAPSVPQSLSAALRLAADQAERIEAQDAALAIVAPKALALDRIAQATGSITIREAAKDLQIKPLTFSNWLRDNRWIYRQGSSNLAHQPRIDAGLMTHKVTLVEVEGKDGVTFERPATQARITPKGLAKLALWFGEVAA